MAVFSHFELKKRPKMAQIFENIQNWHCNHVTIVPWKFHRNPITLSCIFKNQPFFSLKILKILKISFGSVLRLYSPLTSCTVSEKTLEPILRKSLKSRFLGHFVVQKGLKWLKSFKKFKIWHCTHVTIIHWKFHQNPNIIITYF